MQELKLSGRSWLCDHDSHDHCVGTVLIGSVIHGVEGLRRCTCECHEGGQMKTWLVHMHFGDGSYHEITVEAEDEGEALAEAKRWVDDNRFFELADQQSEDK